MSKPKIAFTAKGAWMCHTGKLRKVNEDACFFGTVFSGASTSGPMRAELTAGHWVIAVSDGIGGHKAGAYASREVVTALSTCKSVSMDAVEDLLQNTNHRLFNEGMGNDDLTGTGATVVGLIASSEGLHAFNVGDARLYRQEGGKLQLITRDDSVEQMLVTEGLIRAHDGIRPATMHALTQSVGGSSEYMDIETHFYELGLEKSSRFIICTDGISDMLSIKDMERACVSALDPDAAVQGLFRAAMDAGGRDNITVAVVDVEVVK